MSFYSLKLGYSEYLSPEELGYLGDVSRQPTKKVKVTSNQLDIIPDRYSENRISRLNGVKLIYSMGVGCLILIGNLGCSFKPPHGGEFWVRKIIYDPLSDYQNIKGEEIEVTFSKQSYPTRNEDIQELLGKLKNSKNFLFNIKQFDEFMEIFNYYKILSNELNNNKTFEIFSMDGKEYCFVSTEIKEIEHYIQDDYTEVKNIDGIVIGYRFEDYIYERLPNDIKESIRFLIDVTIKASKEDIKRLKNIGSDNIYLSDYERITEKNLDQIKQFQLVNVLNEKDKLILSGELKDKHFESYRFLNLYDMGQKIKIESIDNSLRLIKQGNTGAASDLLSYLIGDTPMPTKSKHRITQKMEKYMFGLNESQKMAFAMCIDGSQVSLIKGPPGTGKTHVINAIVQYITKELKEKVIISSQTHIAIDNVLDKLMENYDAIIPNRITNRRNKYSDLEIDKTLYKTWGSKFEQHNERAKNKKLANAIMNDMKYFKGEYSFSYSRYTETDYDVIGATTTTSAIAGKKGLRILDGYDWLIIDEVSKCPITEVLRYLPYVEKIIMVGDDYQLAPILEFSKDEVKHLPSFDEDKFERLQQIYVKSVFADVLDKAREQNRIVELEENYRSTKDILEIYNVFYDGKLLSRRNEKNHKVEFNSQFFENEQDVYFIEVLHGKEVKEGTSRYNLEELKATRCCLEDLIASTLHPEMVNVAAIFPYAAQISHFQKENIDLINKARKIFKTFEIDTVDAFQGKEADVVLVNTVIAEHGKNFLEDFRRINVSLSRAKDKLFIFGNSKILSKIDMKTVGGQPRTYFKEIIQTINNQSTYKYEYDYSRGGLKRNEFSSKSKLIFK